MRISLFLGYLEKNVFRLKIYRENFGNSHKGFLNTMATAPGDEVKVKSDRTAFIVGYTGESGKSLVKQAAVSNILSKVRLLGRREVQLPVENPDKFEQKIVNFDDLESHDSCFQNAEVGFCCLGSTRKQGTDVFVKVDRDYVLKTAEIAKRNGCKHFCLVSSGGANAKSSFLYMKTKGEVEERLKEMNFEKLSIFRPALLLCDRQESRPMEAFFRCIVKPLAYLMPTRGTIPTDTLAKGMLYEVINPDSKSINVYENEEIHAMAKKLSS